MAQRRITAVGGTLLLGLALSAGCASSSPHGGVPHLEPSEELVLQGGSPLVYRAPADGQVSVYDLNKDEPVFTGPINADDVFELDPPRQEARVGGRLAATDLRRGDVLRVTYMASGMAK